MSALMLVGFIDTLLTVHWPLGCGTGAPYLSIMAWVRQTWVVRGPPAKGDPAGACIPGGMGDCCQVVLLVISHRPGFLLDCAQAKMAIARKQQPRAR
jgi:hypothetical protein